MNKRLLFTLTDGQARALYLAVSEIEAGDTSEWQQSEFDALIRAKAALDTGLDRPVPARLAVPLTATEIDALIQALIIGEIEVVEHGMTRVETAALNRATRKLYRARASYPA